MKTASATFSCIIISLTFCYCSKTSSDEPTVPVAPDPVIVSAVKINEVSGSSSVYYNITGKPLIKFLFNVPIDHSSISNSIAFKELSGATVAFTTSFENNDSAVIIQPQTDLKPITQFIVEVSNSLKSQKGSQLKTPVSFKLVTAIDSTDKFQRVSDDELLNIVQKQTFKYFWDFGHPVSGLARERNTSGDLVTSGGSGFGVMAIVAAIHRNFISRAEGLARMQKIVSFLKNKADRFHGAFPHWLDGNTG